MDKVKIVCRALFIDDKKRILFVKKEGSDFWSLPGGKLDAEDQSLNLSLTREIKEELNIDINIGDIKFVKELHKNNTRYIELIWEVLLVSGIVPVKENIYELSNHELVDVKWIGFSDLNDNDIKPEFLKEYILNMN